MKKYLFLIVGLSLLSTVISKAQGLLQMPIVYDSLSIPLEGFGHMQGTAHDGQYIYVTYSKAVIKADKTGEILKVDSSITYGHFGGVTYTGNKVIIAGRDSLDKSDIFIYSADSLVLDTIIHVYDAPEISAVGIRNDTFYLGSRISDANGMYVYHYDTNFNYLAVDTIKSDSIFLGIQCMEFFKNAWWLSTYSGTFKLDKKFNIVATGDFSFPTGLAFWNDSLMLFGKNGGGDILVALPPDTVTSVNIMIESEKLSLYPNPTYPNERIVFESRERVEELSVVDLNGNIVHGQKLRSAKGIIEWNKDVSGGIYFFTFRYETGKEKTIKMLVFQ